MKKVYKMLLLIIGFGLISQTAFAARDVTDLVNDREVSSATRGGSGGGSFNMKNEIPKYFDARVTKVKVRHNTRINAVQFTWEYKNGTKTKKSTYYGGTGGTESSFTLSDGEYINKIKIWGTESNSSKGRVGRISFTTSKGKVYDYGETADSLQQWGKYSASQIIGLWGREGTEIDRAGIITAPLVDLQVVDISLRDKTYESSQTATTFTSSQVLFNDSSSSQSTQVSVAYTEETSFSNNYSDTAGITKTNDVTVSTKANVFGIGEISASIAAGVASQKSLTIGKSNSSSTKTTTTIKVDANAAPRSIVVAEAVVYYGEEDVDYIMTVKNKFGGERFFVLGTFSGTNTTVYGSWTKIGTIRNGVVNIYKAFENEYGYYEN